MNLRTRLGTQRAPLTPSMRWRRQKASKSSSDQAGRIKGVNNETDPLHHSQRTEALLRRRHTRASGPVQRSAKEGRNVLSLLDRQQILSCQSSRKREGSKGLIGLGRTASRRSR